MADLQIYKKEEAKAKFDESRLLRSEYTIALLKEAERIGRLTSEEVLDIKAKLMNHLAEVTDEYTEGRSTSLPYEESSDLMSSIYFNVDAYLIAKGDVEKALVDLKEKTAAYLYDNGGLALKRVQTDCAALLFNVKKTRLIGATEAYNRTIDEDIRAFFKEYNIRYAAHKNPVVPRYRLALKPGGAGVVRIKRYLSNLLIENAFCAV